MRITTIFPLVNDIVNIYRKKRMSGLSRETAVCEVLEDYRTEMDDTDTAAQVRIGLAEALCKKKN